MLNCKICWAKPQYGLDKKMWFFLALQHQYYSQSIEFCRTSGNCYLSILATWLMLWILLLYFHSILIFITHLSNSNLNCSGNFLECSIREHDFLGNIWTNFHQNFLVINFAILCAIYYLKGMLFLTYFIWGTLPHPKHWLH